MAISPLAGKPAPKEMLIAPASLEREYYSRKPDPAEPAQQISFGTSGHRGSPFTGSFNEAHVLAIAQAICDYRRRHGISGPLYMGRDTHAVSGPGQRTALEVLAANGVETVIQGGNGVTPTPAISRVILVHNRGRTDRLAEPARGRDHRPHGQGSQRALSRPDSRVRHALLFPYRRASDAGAEGTSREALSCVHTSVDSRR
jgi:phosphoglucomutase